MGATRELSDFVVRSKMEGFPDAVIEMGKKCLLDWIGVALGGAREVSARIVLDLVREAGGEKQATLLATGMKTSLVNAALVNGTMAHALDYDDANSVVRAHVSAPLIAALLPVAEYKGLGGCDFITALVTGYEVSTRVGSALGKKYYEAGWHATAILGRLGTAAGVGRLMDLGSDRLAAAMGIAATQAAGLRDVFGTMTKPFHAGKAAADGILAVLLAKKGFTAPTDILDEGSGFSRVFSPEYRCEFLTENLGRTYGILNNNFKPYAACLLVHPAVDGLISLKKKHLFEAEEVERVRIEVAPFNLKVAGNDRPKSGLEGKFSLHFSAALALLFGHGRNSLFTDIMITDPAVRNQIEKIAASSNPALEETEAQITVMLKNGRVHETRVDSPKGDPRNPLSFEEIEEKFADLASTVLPGGRIEKIIGLVRRLEELKDMSTLVSLCCLQVESIR